jgi:hypothetical protein
MLTEQTPLALLDKFKALAEKKLGERTGVLVSGTSVVSLQTTRPCFLLSPALALPRGLANSRHVREFAHIHAVYNPEWGWSSRQGGGGGSQHTTLAPLDCKRLIDLGWAEWHPMATAGHPLVLVYAPRDETEVELGLQILNAAADFYLSASQQQAPQPL